MNSLAVEVSDLSVSRSGLAVLHDVSLAAAPGQIIGLLGPSGSGKSTLLRSINRLLEPPPGAIRVGGDDVTALNVLELRRRVGMVFQQPSVFPGDVADNLRYGPALIGQTVDDAEIARLLALASLEPSLAEKPASELSGGQAQRVALARTLANHPQVLLLDEPTSALDPASRLHIEEMVVHAARVGGVTVLWVTHAVEQAERVADRLYLLVEGRIVDQGGPEHLLADENRHGHLLQQFAAGELEEAKRA